MRVSWAQAAAGAAILTVLGGLIVLPARLLGPMQSTALVRLPPLVTPQAVEAAPQAVEAAPAVPKHHRVSAPAPTAALPLEASVAQLATVARSSPAPAAAPAHRPAVHHAAAPAPQSPGNQHRRRALPPDETPAPAPAPAPAPVPAPPPAPAPAPTPPPVVTPAPPARVLADTGATTPPDGRCSDNDGPTPEPEHDDADHGNGNGNDRGHGHAADHGNDHGPGRGHGK